LASASAALSLASFLACSAAKIAACAAGSTGAYAVVAEPGFPPAPTDWVAPGAPATPSYCLRF